MDKTLLITIIIFVGLSFFMLLLFWYILKRDKVIEQKFAAFELSLEEVHKEIYELKKETNTSSKEKLEKIERIIESIVDDIRAIEKKNLEIITSLKEEVDELKNKIRKNSLPELNNMINKSDEERIINLYKNGYTIEEISRELRIPAGEIELILKFSSI